MTLPALRLLEASGFTPMLTGKRWAEDLMSGMGWRFDPIEGHVTEDLHRIRYISNHLGPRPLGLLFPNSFSSALLFSIGRVRNAGFPTDGRRFLLDKVVEEPGTMHEVERFFRLAHGAIKAWGGTPAWDSVPEELGMRLLARHEAAARNLMAEHDIPENFALLAPIARGLHHGKEKQWKHFNELCGPLRDMGIEPIVFPSVREEEANHAACPNARILPPTTLGNYAALAKRARIVIANDSGISHVAAAVSANQITLLGVTDPARTRPWNSKAVCLGNNTDGWPSLDEVLSALTRSLNH
ncbi:MAG: glycosyltransferase family 9 protein [Sutterella wadsworthensis]|jgi:heptosyltransferase II|nr:glycosyltransferase family 9 protein [Sutterella wadsworthensis]MCI7117102.1 glycosyltransferase family 9 protein [Sutterella wadsworthensis]